jgi:hypothetical protein
MISKISMMMMMKKKKLMTTKKTRKRKSKNTMMIPIQLLSINQKPLFRQLDQEE